MRKGIYPFIFLVVLGFLFLPINTFAQQLSPADKARLEQELVEVEAEQKRAENELASAQAQSSSLSRDIAILTAKIKTAQLEIKAKNLLIQTLGNDIKSKQQHIENLEGHIVRGKQSLADILRKTNELDSYSLPEVILSQSTVAGFFEDVDDFGSVQNGLQSTFDKLRTDQAETTAEKEVLDTRRNAEIDARYAIQIEENNIKNDEEQKKQLLAISKGNEKAYSSLIAEKRSKAASIRAQLFALRDAAAIPFGQALQYATLASSKSGVRPAFLLAILTQESSLGSNVGSCYVTNASNGDGINAKTGKAVAGIMSPTRDVPVFQEILKDIGGEMSKTVVSCPQSFGWGGAMGPAQFIPSTWVLLTDRIEKALGLSSSPDPWNPVHAFMASALYLGDLGASAGGYTAERNAACRYYSGKSCGLVRGNTTYGNSVLAHADRIQRTMIDPLQGL